MAEPKKVYLNLLEQVEKNKNDIQGLKEAAIVLDEFGIKVIGQVDDASELPDPEVYEVEGEFGDAYAVGTEPPYEFYIFTREFAGQEEPQWFNIGYFPVPGPQGEPGAAGQDGTDGRGIASIAKTSTSGLNDIYTITYTDGTTFSYVVKNGANGVAANIVGASATINNATGTPQVTVTLGGTDQARTFAFDFKNIKGSQGAAGEPGSFIIAGQVANSSLLPSASGVQPKYIYLVGASAPYDVYAIVEAGNVRSWINLGPIAVTVSDTKVGADSWSSTGTLPSVILNEIVNTTTEDFIKIGDRYFAKQSAGHYYAFKRVGSDMIIYSMEINLSTGAWTIEEVKVMEFDDIFPRYSFNASSKTIEDLFDLIGTPLSIVQFTGVSESGIYAVAMNRTLVDGNYVYRFEIERYSTGVRASQDRYVGRDVPESILIEDILTPYNTYYAPYLVNGNEIDYDSASFQDLLNIVGGIPHIVHLTGTSTNAANYGGFYLVKINTASGVFLATNLMGNNAGLGRYTGTVDPSDFANTLLSSIFVPTSSYYKPLCDLQSNQTITGIKTVEELDFKNSVIDHTYKILAPDYDGLVFRRDSSNMFIMRYDALYPTDDSDGLSTGKDIGKSDKRLKNLYIAGKINPNSSGYGLSLPDTALFTADKTMATTDEISLPEISAPSSTTLSDAEISLIIKGCIIKGDFAGRKNLLILPAVELTNTYVGSLVSQDGYGQVLYGRYVISKSTKVFSTSGYLININDNGNLALTSLVSLNGKTIPVYPSSSGTFVLKCVNGTLTWVQEV